MQRRDIAIKTQTNSGENYKLHNDIFKIFSSLFYIKLGAETRRVVLEVLSFSRLLRCALVYLALFVVFTVSFRSAVAACVFREGGGTANIDICKTKEIIGDRLGVMFDVGLQTLEAINVREAYVYRFVSDQRTQNCCIQHCVMVLRCFAIAQKKSSFSMFTLLDARCKTQVL